MPTFRDQPPRVVGKSDLDSCHLQPVAAVEVVVPNVAVDEVSVGITPVVIVPVVIVALVETNLVPVAVP